ncbi:MAG: DUF2807 domain-containing protein [Bacteroidales bacterium]|nr:DUF2807 domain-containing protein [Bacteroidales bacterium]
MKTFGMIQKLTALLLTGLLFTACDDIWDRNIDGNGDREIESRSLETFSNVEINGDFEVQIDLGESSKAVIETDENLMQYIITHVSGNKLIIETRDDVNLRPSHPIELTITTPALDQIELNGSGYVYCYEIETEELSVYLAGSGQIEFYNTIASSAEIELDGSGFISGELFVENLTTKIEGSGEIRAEGTSVSTNHKIIGSGRINADDVIAGVSTVYISGSGIIDTYASEALDVTIIGSGIVYYKGNADLDSYISGSGKVIKR